MEKDESKLIEALSQLKEPHCRVLHRLVRDPATLNDTFIVGRALSLAVQRSYVKSVRILLEAGVSPNISSGNYGTMVLHQACYRQQTKIIRELLKYNADVNAVDDQNKTPLHIVIENGNIENMQMLLQNGAKVNAVDEDGRTPLCVALDGSLNISLSQDELSAVVQVLLSAGADVNVRDFSGMTPLHYAVFFHLPDVIRLLLRRKADANARNYNGDTPLHGTADMDEPCAAIRELLKCGAVLDSLNNKGHSSLYRAVDSTNVEATQELLRWGASFDIITCLESLKISASKRRPLGNIRTIAQELTRYEFIQNPHSLRSTRQHQLRHKKVSNILRNISNRKCKLNEFQQACLLEAEALSMVICDCGKSSIWGSINNFEECNCDAQQAILKFFFSGRKSNFSDAFLYKLSKEFLLDANLNLISYFAFKESKKRLILPWPCMKGIDCYVSFEDGVSFLQSKQSEMEASEFEKYLAFVKGESSVKSSSEISPPASKRLRVS